MKILESVPITIVQKHEQDTGANVRLGGYWMPYQPDDFAAFRVLLESSDLDRLYLLGQFHVHTAGNSCMLKDVLPCQLSHHRVIPFVGSDLRSLPHRAILIVSTAAQLGPLVVYDGNHRAQAHFLSHKNIDAVPAIRMRAQQDS